MAVHRLPLAVSTADGLPRLGGGIRDLDSFIFAEKQTRLLGLGRAVGTCRLSSDERE